MGEPRGLPARADKARAVRSMFDSIAPRYDFMNRLLTLGMDIGWRRKAVDALEVAAGSVVLDIACGTGDFCRELESRQLTAVGLDVSWGMLRAARTRAPLIQADGLRLPVRDGGALGVTCGFALRNVTDIEELFAEFARVLLPGGRVAVLEVSEPESPVLRAGHSIYFRKVVPLIGGLLSDRRAYRYLPESTAYLPATADLLQLIGRAGFDCVERTPLGLGAAQLITATRRHPPPR
ncbi:MAG: ubiquinone/menaquinone biosynthesis methyltransferase [Actinobacteria bacterium]|nr:ubiquinone/menaquinone biosynthesis methyltransferase [Actinomycetota bacterium]